MKERLLIVEADQEMQAQLRWALASEYDHVTAADHPSALRAFRDALPHVVVIDLGYAPESTKNEGLAILSDLLSIQPLTKIVFISEKEQCDTVRQIDPTHVYEVLSKPLDMDQLKFVLARCYYLARLEREHREFTMRLRRDSFEGLLGACPSIQSVLNAIRRVAASDAPVLIIGASGTGKEVTARAIHHRSSRKEGKFDTFNCAAIPEDQIERALFGSENETFTGAHVQRKGRIENANGGTLFLKEIGYMPSSVQIRLLRLLQEQTIERVGGSEPINVNCRVVAATNEELKNAVKAGEFRHDLYYQLAVVQITLPRLRERGEDVVLLARAILQEVTTHEGKPGVKFSTEAVHAIRQHSWPGNVRELQNRIRHAVIMNDGNRITSADLFESAPSDTTLFVAGTSLREVRKRVDRDMIRHALGNHKGNISAASATLGISRPALYNLMQKLGVGKDL
jgi:two-component system, NtrC family, response regulator